jgi:hypothetical protein
LEYLTRLSSSAEAGVYALGGDHQGRVHRYLISTPSTRAICNRPEVLGCEYTAALRTAVTAALVHSPLRQVVEGHPEHQVCVLNFLRGGLNFGLREALCDAYGFNCHSSAFMSSQRSRVDGRWAVREDMYRKLRIPRDAVIVVGDVVATGVTVDNGLQVLHDELLGIGSSVRHLVFFTIGCHKLEKRLAEYDERFRRSFPGYRDSHLVYFEGKFRLVDSSTRLRIAIPGTDLVRTGAVLTPEFELSQFDRLSHALERCAIYDAGSRAFEVREYARDVLGYWTALGGLASRGWTLRDALDERWPEERFRDRASFLEHCRQAWRGVPDSELKALYDCHVQRWTGPFRATAETSEALAAVCQERMAVMRSFVN